MDMVNEAKNFGVITSAGKVDWPALKEARDTYITRLNGIYERNLGNSGVKIIEGVSVRSVGCGHISRVLALLSPLCGCRHARCTATLYRRKTRYRKGC